MMGAAADLKDTSETSHFSKRRFLWLMGMGTALLAGGVVGVNQLSHPSLTPFRDLTTQSTSLPGSALRATFLGTATILFRDGSSQIMTDGFLSRPPRSKVFSQKLEPDIPEIQYSLERAGIRSLDALFVAHSHYDHAMDSARVASITGSDLIGSESTANIARAEYLPNLRIHTVQGGEHFRYGQFDVTVFQTPHSPDGRYPGKIDADIKPPLRVNDYREGLNFSFLVQHRSHRILVVSSANFVPGLFENVRVDDVFLSIGTLGKQSEEFSENYWQEVVVRTRAKRVILIHWDDFMHSLREPLKPFAPAFDSFTEAMQRIRKYADRDGVRILLPQSFDPIVLE
jgi:L-ascorbate metabolism protein UlaG (beta-lactamase superfamily)